MELEKTVSQPRPPDSWRLKLARIVPTGAVPKPSPSPIPRGFAVSVPLNLMGLLHSPPGRVERSEDVWDSLKLVGGEVSDGFKRIRKSL